MTQSLIDEVFQIVSELDSVTAKEIQEVINKNGISVDKEKINSLLYGDLHEKVIRDKNVNGVAVWRMRTNQFSAASGLEAKFYNELLKRRIVSSDNSQLDFGIKNIKNGKRYQLDIVIRKQNQRYNIEIDGFDHIRADALESIDRQIAKLGPHAEIEIDWMDHEKSYAKYSLIDTKKVYKWCGENLDWCIRYHEELLWPKDITRNIWLIDKGWKVLRIWNEQIRRDMDGCAELVKEWIS